jgi:hypothetical protein
VSLKETKMSNIHKNITLLVLTENPQSLALCFPSDNISANPMSQLLPQEGSDMDDGLEFFFLVT